MIYVYLFWGIINLESCTFHIEKFIFNQEEYLTWLDLCFFAAHIFNHEILLHILSIRCFEFCYNKVHINFRYIIRVTIIDYIFFRLSILNFLLDASPTVPTDLEFEKHLHMITFVPFKLIISLLVVLFFYRSFHNKFFA